MRNKYDHLVLIVFENLSSLPSSPLFGYSFFQINYAFLGIKAVFLMYSFCMQMIQNIALKYLHMQNIDGLCQSPLPPAVSWEDVRLGLR